MRTIKLLLVVLCLAGLAAAVFSADLLVDVYVGGKKVNFQPQARVRAGVTYAPLRAAAESVGAHVEWKAASRSAQICTDTGCATIKQSQAIMVGNSMLIPVRLMSEALGRDVTWDPAANAVRIK